MLKYILKKVGYLVVTLWIILTATFFMMYTMPGDATQSSMKVLPEAVAANLKAKWGLDKPVGEQYVIYLQNLLQGELGESYTTPGLTANTIIEQRFPASLQLGLQAVALGLVLGIVLGILAALHRGHWIDFLTIFIAILGVSIPSFVFAALLQKYAAGGYFPIVGWVTSGSSLADQFKYTALPTLSAAIGGIATYSRFMRSSVLDVLNNDYILLARSKGLSRFQIIRRHVMRNAITPIITIVAPQIAGVVTGSFVIERMFSIPGLGRYYVDSVNGRDYPMILATTVFFSFIFIFCMVVMDILYALVDPRVRKGIIEGKKAR
ncbi:MAG: ABC transporter permease [Oscillospiraceae bacterium]|nr:ABC transporter permease [Oscillospiraceae bacterium]